jgi:hypothetical protein
MTTPKKAGRKPTDPATHRRRLVVTLSPEVLALVAALRAETGLTQSAVVELALRRLAKEEAR